MTHHLVGVTEIAAMLDVSRQRADQLSRTKGFPEPVADLAHGRVWETEAVVAWIEGSGTRTPRHTIKTVPTIPSGLPQGCHVCGRNLVIRRADDGTFTLRCPTFDEG
jgi:hypothetical protein